VSARPAAPARFIADVLANPGNRAILARWPELGLPGGDAWLVGGCLFQTLWNLRSGRAPEAGIKDHDIFYFDAGDLSARAERAVQAGVDAVLSALPLRVEAVNQARVHLWYESHFGHPSPALRSARDGIDRFLVVGTCVGVRPRAGARHLDELEVYAPHGLATLYEGVLAPNPLTDHRALYEAKLQSYCARWPWLRSLG
jgi:hypothetical protein